MNSSNTKLKPLDHKKSLNNNLPAAIQAPSKQPPKKISTTTNPTSTSAKKQVDPAQPTNSAYKKVTYTRSSTRTPSTKIQQF